MSLGLKKFSYTPGWRDREDINRHGHQPRSHVGILKLGLPLITIFIVASIILWPSLKTFTQPSSTATIEQVLKNNPKLENKVINPKLNALDKTGRPFLIQADSALQNDSLYTVFIHPNGHMQLKDGTLVTFKGDKGHYYKESNIFKIVGHVILTTDKGAQLRTTSADFNFNENQAEGHEPIAGIGDNGESIHAQGFKINHNHDTIIFTGRTRVSLAQR
ncbi:MAG: LPS export ABC transporter periplasmic protein LptC [Alphaproteobacteria bacterium]|nr:LPS export ABC transporter periplasmic protein LptC [Alphaproteobacteria bacterium]